MDPVRDSNNTIESNRDRRRPAGCSPAVLTTFFLVGLLMVPAYVLSIGPAAYLVEHDILPEQPLEYFYFPLVWLVKTFEPARDIVMWYLSFWTDLG